MLQNKVFAVGFCLTLFGCSRSGATPGLKNPTSYFDIRGSLPDNLRGSKVEIHEFRAGPDGLYFCISPSPNTRNSIILETGWSGNRQNVFVPPQDQEVSDFDVGEHGNLYVLMNGSRKSSLLLYAPDGRLQSTLPISHFANGLSVTNGKPVVLLPDRSGTRLEVLDSSGPRDVSIALIRTSPKPAMTSLPDGRIVLADKAQGNVYLVDITSGNTSSFRSTPTSPASGGESSSPMQAIHTLSLTSAASTPEGDIYLIAGSYRMAEGAPLSRFDSHGTLIEPFRCALPTFEDMKSPHNPEGYMLPTSIGVYGNSLFLVSPQGMIAAYSR